MVGVRMVFQEVVQLSTSHVLAPCWNPAECQLDQVVIDGVPSFQVILSECHWSLTQFLRTAACSL